MVQVNNIVVDGVSVVIQIELLLFVRFEYGPCGPCRCATERGRRCYVRCHDGGGGIRQTGGRRRGTNIRVDTDVGGQRCS